MHNKSAIFFCFVLFIVSIVSYGGRQSTTFPIKVSSYDATSGRGTAAEFYATVSCQNLGTVAQTLRISLPTTIVNMQIKTDSTAAASPPFTGWVSPSTNSDFYQCGFNYGGSAISGSSCTGNFGFSIRDINSRLEPKGDLAGGDSKEFKFSFKCAYTQTGPDCSNGAVFGGFINKDDNTNTSPAKADDGVNSCPPNTSTRCEDAINADFTHRARVSVREDKGAILCSLFSSVTITSAQNEVSIPTTTPFNGGRPF